MKTIATLLSGGEGAGVGAASAGLRHIWGIEYDEAIAGVARTNGFGLIVDDIQNVDPRDMKSPDVLHASPECKNASSASHKGKEARLDVEIAECIVRYLEVMRPRVFTLENVFAYRKFQSFRLVLSALNRLGYFTHFGNLNSADFGVPQTRRRLILRAVRGGLVPTLPPAEPWVGWYSAIQDLIPTLPESQFAPWQLGRLRGAVPQTVILSVDRDESRARHRPRSEPSPTIRANAERNMPRAFIVGGQYAKPQSCEDRPPQTRDGGEPVFTVTAVNKGDWKVWLIDGQNASNPSVRVMTTTVMSNDHGTLRARLPQGKVVKMTPRCLARFQSFPDSYVLPRNNALACRVIGNACPPLMMQRIYEGLVR
ncbi:MAG: DNA cytosine methyltransferase [Dehalococcoidales bacterium]